MPTLKQVMDRLEEDGTQEIRKVDRTHMTRTDIETDLTLMTILEGLEHWKEQELLQNSLELHYNDDLPPAKPERVIIARI